MRAEITRRTLGDHRRGLVGWSIGASAYVVMLCAVWPTIRNSPALLDALKDYPEAIQEVFGGEAGASFATAAGYLNAELFSLMIPLLLAVFAIGFAASSTGGEEERGFLDLLCALPVRRSRIVLERAAALVIAVVAVSVVMTVAMLVAGAVVDLGIPAGDVVAACAGSALVALVAGSVALCVGAVHGTRAAAIAVGSTVLAGTYLLQVLSGFVDAFRPTRWASPLYWANGTVPLLNGWPVGRDLVLLGAVVVLVGAGVLGFTRRDLRG